MRLKILVSYFFAGLILLLVVFADSHSQWLFLCFIFYCELTFVGSVSENLSV